MDIKVIAFLALTGLKYAVNFLYGFPIKGRVQKTKKYLEFSRFGLKHPPTLAQNLEKK